MANTTLSAIMARFRTVLEADPLNLQPTVEPFSDEPQPATLVDNAYRIVSGGTVNKRAIGYRVWAVQERIGVHLARKMGSDGQVAQEALLDLLDIIESKVVQDGDNNSYQASMEKGSRKFTRPKDAQVINGAVNFIVDFDWSET